MISSFRWAVRGVLVLAAVLLLGPTLRAGDNATADDEQILKKANQPADGPALLEFFRKRTLTRADQERMDALVRQLGSKTFRLRSQASAELIRLGPCALPVLRRALKDPDVEVRSRADKCLKAIKNGPGPALPSAAARLLKARKPTGAAPVLLAYLPFADDEDVEEEVVGALLVLAFADGTSDAALPAALRDPHPARRAAAAYLLGRAGTADQRQEVRKLLADGQAAVRFQAAQGLLLGKDKTAVPALIALLAEGPFELARKAEDILVDVRGEPVSKADLPEDPARRREARAAWEGWWKTHEARVDLGRLTLNNERTRVLKARRMAEQCTAALLRLDVPAFKKTLKFPVLMEGPGNQQHVQGPEQIDQMFKTLDKIPQIKEELKKMSFVFKKTGRVDEYLPIARPHEKDFLAKLRRSEVVVVYLEMRQNGQPAGGGGLGALFVRVAAGRAAVVGFGTPQQQAPARKK